MYGRPLQSMWNHTIWCQVTTKGTCSDTKKEEICLNSTMYNDTWLYNYSVHPQFRVPSGVLAGSDLEQCLKSMGWILERVFFGS